LSATVGRDLAEVHRAHRALAVKYFARIKGDIQTFIDTVYRPYQIRETMDKFKLVDRLKAAPSPEEAFKIAEMFNRLVSEQAERYRRELVGSIESQEAEVLGAIDEAHARLQTASAVVTGHLASVRKVHDAQNEALSKFGLEGLREKVGDKVAAMSDRLAGLVEKARRGEQTADEAIKAVKELVEKFNPGSPDE